MKYKTRRKWRHFKYRLLELFFGKPQLRKLIDIDRLDFEDAVRLTVISAEKQLTTSEHDYFMGSEKMKYGLKYALARQMADILAKHIEVSEILDIDTGKYLCVSSVTLIERKEDGRNDNP